MELTRNKRLEFDSSIRSISTSRCFTDIKNTHLLHYRQCFFASYVKFSSVIAGHSTRCSRQIILKSNDHILLEKEKYNVGKYLDKIQAQVFYTTVVFRCRHAIDYTLIIFVRYLYIQLKIK